MAIDTTYQKLPTESIDQYNARIKAYNASKGGLPSLPTGGGASPTPLPGQTPSLPDTGTQQTPLLSFANALDAAVNLARKSRNASSLDMMKPYQGTVAASDFSQILGNLNNASDTTSRDLIKRATEAAIPAKLDTSVVEIAGRKVLINNQTGETIKNLGSSTLGTDNTFVPVSPLDTSAFLKDKTPEQIASFNTIPSGDRASIMQLVNGDALLTDIVKSRGANTQAQINKIISEATAIDPSFSVNANKQRYAFKTTYNNPNGKDQTQINAINTGLGHLAEFKSAADALGNTIYLPVNKLKNYLEKNTGDPRVSNLNTVITALSGELASIYKNGTAPTDQETAQWRDTILASFSKSQSQGVADTTANLVSNKLQSLAQSYKNVMGSYPDNPIVNTDVLSQLQQAGVDTTKIESKLKSQGYSSPSTTGGTFDSASSRAKYGY